jgi:hypothetical protein
LSSEILSEKGEILDNYAHGFYIKSPNYLKNDGYRQLF